LSYLPSPPKDRESNPHESPSSGIQSEVDR
jgi:hypothetical protein